MHVEGMEMIEVFVITQIDGGLPSQGGRHSFQLNGTCVPKAAGLGSVIDLVRKEFK